MRGPFLVAGELVCRNEILIQRQVQRHFAVHGVRTIQGGVIGFLRVCVAVISRGAGGVGVSLDEPQDPIFIDGSALELGRLAKVSEN